MNAPTSNLPAIQSLWIGESLSNLEKLCIQSFLDHGHEFHLYTYADVVGVPRGGGVIKDANEILPWHQLTGGAAQDVAALSDYFRYALLGKIGGWWVDMDVICLRPFDFHEQIIFAHEHDGKDTFNNSPLRFPAAHPLMKTMQELCENRLHLTGLGNVGLGGPPIFTKQIYKARLQNLAQPSMRFYPPQSHAATYFNATYRGGLHFPANTFALHLFNSTLGPMGIDKNARFDAESCFEQLKIRHGIMQIAGARRVTSTQVNALLDAKRKKRERQARRRRNREKILTATVVILAAMLIVSHL